MTGASAIASQLEVLNALILRETRTRFGTQQLGYLWAFIEPALWIGTFFAIFTFTGRQPPPGMTMAGFVVTGLLPFSMFRETISRASSAVDGNKGLLFYPQVRPLDLVMARAALEGATGSSVMFLILGFDALQAGKLEVDDPLLTILAMLMVMLLGTSIGVIVGSLSVFSNAVTRIVPPLLRPMFWISGVFFTANSLPSQVREPMLINPVLHVVELVRAGIFKDYKAPYADPGYVATWIVLAMALGLLLERVARRRLEVT